MRTPIIVALDFPTAEQALTFSEQLDPKQVAVKVGFTLFTAAGPHLVDALVTRGFKVFLDMKYHDIPNTVENSVRQAANLGVWMVNVHALGGRAMLEAAVRGLSGLSQKPKLLAVTVLTSMEQADLLSFGSNLALDKLVVKLASLAHTCGCDGVVCSPREVADIRAAGLNDFLLVTPGIRLADSAQDDQKRSLNPIAALQAGSDYLVIGRPITQAENPLAVINTLESMLIGDNIHVNSSH